MVRTSLHQAIRDRLAVLGRSWHSRLMVTFLLLARVAVHAGTETLLVGEGLLTASRP